jgi:hypothetical protein
LRISGFTLVNAFTDEDIMLLEDNDTIDYRETGTHIINFRAEVDSIASKVLLKLTGKRRSRNWNIDYTEPYTLFPEWNGNYSGRHLRPGNYSITAYPFRTSWYDIGIPLTINFTVIGKKHRHHCHSHFKSTESVENEYLTNQVNETTIFPIPFNNELNISVSNEMPVTRDITVRIFNSTGIEVYNYNHLVVDGENLISLELSELPNGLYIIKIDELQFTKPIIKN